MILVLLPLHVAMGQNPNRICSEHPNPNQIDHNLGGDPKRDPIGFDPQPYCLTHKHPPKEDA